jgi:hypothetical protein
LPTTSAVSIQTGDSPTENAIAQENQAYVYVSNGPVPTSVLTSPGTTSPVPTFTCLGSCPITPSEPLPGDGGNTPGVGGQPGSGNQTASPTPCPDTQVNSQSTKNDVQANYRKGKYKKHRGGGNGDGLLQVLIKLLELLLQLLGGGTPAPSTPSDPGTPNDPGTPANPGTPGDQGGSNPCAPVQNEPTDAPQPTEPPAASEVPASQAPTVKPTTTVSSNLCGKVTAGAQAGSLPSCSGLTATQPTSNGFYNVTNFGCNTGFPKDPSDNCIGACQDQGIPECAGGKTGAACEEAVQWFSANADQYGCNSKLKVTNPKTGKAVIVRVIDQGPGCSIQKSTADFDMSQAAYKEINGDDGVVQVEKVDSSTPLGPIPACTQ